VELRFQPDLLERGHEAALGQMPSDCCMKNKFKILKQVLIEKVTPHGHVWNESRTLVPFASRRSQKSLARYI
jgi:hypothetical protein